MYSQNDRLLNEINLEEVQVGETFSLCHTIKQQEVDLFSQLTGDFNPLHVDEGYAKSLGYKAPVVYGMLSASFISTMVGMLVPGKGALWSSQAIEFINPVFVGDTINVVATLKQISPATRMIVLDIIVTNQNGQNIISGESKVKILKPEERKNRMSESDKRVFLVTGGARGIGAATAIELAKVGHSVIVNYVSNESEANNVVAVIHDLGGTACALRADVSNSDQVAALFNNAEEKLGKIKGIVHCAAPKLVSTPFVDASWESFQRQFDVQVKGAFNCAQMALPHMTETKSGVFIFLGSIIAEDTPPTQHSAYISAKSALAAFARTLAVEYGPKGIRINTVSPGMTKTTMIADIPEKVKMLTKMNTPLRRLADPIDVAKVIKFLAGPDAQHITGETIKVCGGITM